MKPLISTKQTEQLIAEAMTKSPVFAKKLAYWFHNRNSMPSQRWLLENLTKALGQDRVASIIGEAVIIANKPLPLRIAHKIGKNVRNLFK
jgi:hypothetical protein